MNIIIDGIDFWDGFTAEKYWSPTKNQNLKEIVNNAIYSGAYTVSEKIDGDWRMLIRSMDGTVTPDIPESKKKFLMESDSRGRELSEQQHGETKPDTGDENTAFAEDEGKGFLCCAASYMIIICIL